MRTSTAPPGLVASSLPVAAAIGVFGVVYGAAARPLLGPTLAVVSSLLVFSGAAQFTMVALVAGGATPVGVLGGVATLALRHLPLGAVLQPRMTTGRGRRALLSWFLLDETTGLALTRDQPPERTLVVSGTLAYVAWVVGTGIGAAGGRLVAVEPVAEALFPVLFVGLAALTVGSRGDALRAVAAGGAGLVVVTQWPAVGALGAVAVAIAVATVVRRP